MPGCCMPLVPGSAGLGCLATHSQAKMPLLGTGHSIVQALLSPCDADFEIPSCVLRGVAIM